MVTPLQDAFAKSKVLRRGMFLVLNAEAVPVKGYKRTWYTVYKDVFETMTEAQIKSLLFDFLQCVDITDDERAEIKQLLQLSQTALTEEQTRQLQNLLY